MSSASLFPPTRTFVSAILFITAVVIIGGSFSGCQLFDKNGDIQTGDVCVQTPATFIPSGTTIPDLQTTAVTRAACVNDNLETTGILSNLACVQFGHRCPEEGCSQTRQCVVDAEIGTPPFILLNGCTFDIATGVCTCDVVVPVGRALRCGCRCSPTS